VEAEKSKHGVDMSLPQQTRSKHQSATVEAEKSKHGVDISLPQWKLKRANTE